MLEVALAASVIVFVVAMLIYVPSPAFSMFHPLTLYSAFHFIVFIARPVLAYTLSYSNLDIPFGYTASPSDKVTAQVISNLGFIAFFAGSRWTGNVPMRFVSTPWNQEEKRRLTQIYVWVVAICGPLAMYSFFRSYADLQAGEYVAGMKLDMSTGVTINTTSNGYITDAQIMAASMAAIWAWLGRFRPWALAPIVLFVLFKAGSGSRGPFITGLVATGLFYAYDKRIRAPGLRVVGLLLMAAVLFRTVGDDRGFALRQWLGFEQPSGFEFSDRDSQRRPLESMDYANDTFLEYLVYVVPQRSGTYDYFLDNFQIFTEPVPRVLWPGKPIGEPFRRVFLFDYGTPVGMTRSLPGEGWYALGWVGVIVWCGLWGLGLGRVYRRFAEGPQTPMQVVCYLVFLPTLIIAFRDGVLISLVKGSGIYLAPVLVWWLLARYFGLPKAAELLQLARKRRGMAVGRDGSDIPTASPSAPTWLPPAVRRRRAALAGPVPVAPPAAGT